MGGLLAFDDLDLEFEDEEEAKKKKNDAFHVDVDLEFGVDSNDGKSRPALLRPKELGPVPVAPPPGRPAPPRPLGEVKKLDEARVAHPSAVKKPLETPPPVAKAAPPRSVGSSALQEERFDFEGQQVVEMREQMRKVQFDADVKVAVAEFKMEFLSELLSDTKIMQHQVEQLLIRINAKHPDMKQEVLMIKKILADFNAKKRK